MRIEKWNKVSNIDGRTPEYITSNNPAYGTEEVYILRKNDGTLVDILTISMIRAGNASGTDEEAVQAYVDARENQAAEPQPETDALLARIAALEDELKAAKILLGVEA